MMSILFLSMASRFVKYGSHFDKAKGKQITPSRSLRCLVFRFGAQAWLFICVALTVSAAFVFFILLSQPPAPEVAQGTATGSGHGTTNQLPLPMTGQNAVGQQPQILQSVSHASRRRRT